VRIEREEADTGRPLSLMLASTARLRTGACLCRARHLDSRVWWGISELCSRAIVERKSQMSLLC